MHFLVELTLLLAAAFTGCGDTPEPSKVRVDIYDMIPWWAHEEDYCIEVVKFKDPSYQQYVLLSRHVNHRDSVGTYLYEDLEPAPITPVEVSTLAGESPFYDLGDGYAMVRFKWDEIRPVPHLYPLLDKKWEELETAQQKFGREHIMADSVIESFRYVPVFALDAYVRDSTVLPGIFSYATHDWAPDGIFYYGYFQHLFGSVILPFRNRDYVEQHYTNASSEEKEQYILTFRQAEKAEEQLAEIMRHMVADGQLDKYTWICYDFDDYGKSFARYKSRYNCNERYRKGNTLVVF